MAKKLPKLEDSVLTMDALKELVDSQASKIKKYEELILTVLKVIENCSNVNTLNKAVFSLGQARERLRIEYNLIEQS